MKIASRVNRWFSPIISSYPRKASWWILPFFDHAHHLWPRDIGWANSTILWDALAFLAVSLTVNASGLNWTWSIVSRIIGLDKFCILSEAIALKVLLLTDHSVSLHGKYPSTVCLGFASSWTLADATVRLLADDTRHVGSLMSPSWRVLGRASCSTRAEDTARFAGSLTIHGTSRSGWYWGWHFLACASLMDLSRSSTVLAASLTCQTGELLPQLKIYASLQRRRKKKLLASSVFKFQNIFSIK